MLLYIGCVHQEVLHSHKLVLVLVNKQKAVNRKDLAVYCQVFRCAAHGVCVALACVGLCLDLLRHKYLLFFSFGFIKSSFLDHFNSTNDLDSFNPLGLVQPELIGLQHIGCILVLNELNFSISQINPLRLLH